MDKEQLREPSALLSPLWKLDDEGNLILQGAWDVWVSQHGKFTMWFKNSPLISELGGEHAIWGRGVPAQIMSLWFVREHQLPLICFSSPLFLLQVHVKVSVPKGIKFVGHPGKHHLTRKKCVAPGEATPTSIVLSVTELGSANITGHYHWNKTLNLRHSFSPDRLFCCLMKQFIVILYMWPSLLCDHNWCSIAFANNAD